MKLLFYLTLLTTALRQVVGTAVALEDGARSCKMKPVTLRPIAIAQKERVRTEVMVLSDDEGSGGRLKSDSWAKMRQWTKARAGKRTTSKKEDEEAALARECLILRSREAAGPPRSRKVGQKKAIMAKRSNNKCDKFLRVPRHKLFWYACKHELKRARYELHKLFWRIKAWWARREAAWQLFRLKLRWFFLRKCML